MTVVQLSLLEAVQDSTMTRKALKTYQRYKKHCHLGEHYVNHLVKRYYICAKFDENHQPCRVAKLDRVCIQCASYMDEWAKLLKTTRLEIITRNLMQGIAQ
jgi:hypothetical protein